VDVKRQSVNDGVADFATVASAQSTVDLPELSDLGTIVVS
jgi:hypothetical protein